MSNRTQLEQQAGKMQAELDKLREQIQQLPEEDERWKPENGEQYYCLSDINKGVKYQWANDSIDASAYATGNCFKTEDEAELHKLRLESMANRWKPEAGAEYWFYRFQDDGPDRYYFNNGALDHIDLAQYAIGNTHPTREAAQAWYDKYGKAWEALLG